MKTLSIKQPYASLIAEGIKDIENRSFKTNFRGTFLIHASIQWHDRLKTNSLYTPEQEKQIVFLKGSYRNSLEYFTNKQNEVDLLTGSIIGQVDLVDCVINHSSIWAEKLNDQVLGEFYEKPIYNWVLENAILYPEPILNVKGKLSFWDYKPEIFDNLKLGHNLLHAINSNLKSF